MAKTTVVRRNVGVFAHVDAGKTTTTEHMLYESGQIRAVLRFKIEPGPCGSGLQYDSQVRAENLLPQYQNEVARRVPQALQQGLYGWEVVDLKVTLIEGEHHVWHTHPLDFAVATPMGIMDGLVNTETMLLEPMLQFRITVPEEFGGK
ncbi:GTP-binding protein [Paenibacillus sp. MER TA 81-3]|uniref:GTP-binding protein n=1 Tax=Paenibacillus sp. MER TA 81-3 TaxID=2939573 RepID=UPI00203E18C3|nr:GTP-binding protein [Paenibacillus sp. MER TA 81-3]MCM3339560.1 GTP-binding protein [Paenibacillus sp. MER TA 81-3]